MSNKTKIEWCDSTWNPVTGCLHDCPYCYARNQANRFKGYDGFVRDYGKNGVHELDVPAERKTKKGDLVTAPYPFNFEPTFHRYRLENPQRQTEPRTIFVGSMTDLFGEWVPDEWIEQVFEACKQAPQHRYLFLTKHPARYIELETAGKLLAGENVWYGSTVTDPDMPYFRSERHHTFSSVEPILKPFSKTVGGHTRADLIILGAETGNRKGKVKPERAWIENIVEDCRATGTPVFMKDSLIDVWGDELIRELPWGVEA